MHLRSLEQARSWCHAELAVLSAAVSCAASSGLATHARQLAWAIEAIPDQWRRWQDQAAVGEIVLAAAGQARDLTGQAYARRHLGKALTVGGNHQQARDHLQKALILFCRSVTGSIRPTQRLALTLSLIILDEPTRSLARGWHALQLYQAVGDSTRQAAALNYMGTWPTPCSGDTSAAWPPASRHSNLLTTPMTRTSGSCSLRPWTASASVAEVPAGVRRPAASGRSLYFRMKIWRQLVRAVRPTRDLDGQDVGAQDAARGVGV